MQQQKVWGGKIYTVGQLLWCEAVLVSVQKRQRSHMPSDMKVHIKLGDQYLHAPHVVSSQRCIVTPAETLYISGKL